MIQLRFHHDLYPPEAVTVASETFAPYATIKRSSAQSMELIEITALDDVDEATVSGEFANYVLGVTVDSSRNRQSIP